MKLIVDRIEEGIAVLEKEDMTREEVAAALLPEGTKEGSVLSFDGEFYSLDSDEETERKRRITEMQKLIYKKAKKD